MKIATTKARAALAALALLVILASLAALNPRLNRPQDSASHAQLHVCPPAC